jgi:hypothetical protein
MSYHHNSKKGRLLQIFQVVKPEGAALTSKDVHFFFMVIYARQTPSTYEIGTLLSRMPEIENIGRTNGIGDSLWRLKEEVV